MTPVAVDQSSAVPPYEQVREQLARAISDGTLVAGTRLPTVRRLAGDLGLAANTVARAYRELEQAGLLQTRGRAGTFAAPPDGHRAQVASAAKDFAALARRLGLEPAVAIEMVTAALQAQQPAPG